MLVPALNWELGLEPEPYTLIRRLNTLSDLWLALASVQIWQESDYLSHDCSISLLVKMAALHPFGFFPRALVIGGFLARLFQQSTIVFMPGQRL